MTKFKFNNDRQIIISIIVKIIFEIVQNWRLMTIFCLCVIFILTSFWLNGANANLFFYFINEKNSNNTEYNIFENRRTIIIKIK